jgi:hypothetical protein
LTGTIFWQGLPKNAYFVPKIGKQAVCPPLRELAKNYITFAKSGLLPIPDGLFGQPGFAYFSLP